MIKEILSNSDKICYIIGAFENGSINIEKSEKDIVICADGGVAIAEKYGIIPDFILGDFDSLGYVPNGDNIYLYPSEKDDSDVGIAIKLGLDKGYKSFVIFGGVGGRLDHTIGNIQLLSYISDNGGRGILIGDKTTAFVLHNESVYLDGDGYISVFSLTDKSEGITLENLKYTLENSSLTNSFPLGLSNEFIKGKTAFLRVQKGKLLIIAEEIL